MEWRWISKVILLSLAVKLFAGADFDLSVTFFALHKATPMKLALASFNPFFASGSVSTIAAHKFAPINARTSLQYENEISVDCSRKNGLKREYADLSEAKEYKYLT